MKLKPAIQAELEAAKKKGVDPSDLETVEELVDLLPDDVQKKSDDARSAWSPGDEVVVTVADAGEGNRHDDPMGRTASGLVVFIRPNGSDPDFQRGDQVFVRLTNVNARSAHAVPM